MQAFAATEATVMSTRRDDVRMTADSIDAGSDVPITWNLWRRGHLCLQRNECNSTPNTTVPASIASIDAPHRPLKALSNHTVTHNTLLFSVDPPASPSPATHSSHTCVPLPHPSLSSHETSTAPLCPNIPVISATPDDLLRTIRWQAIAASPIRFWLMMRETRRVFESMSLS